MIIILNHVLTRLSLLSIFLHSSVVIGYESTAATTNELVVGRDRHSHTLT